MAVDPKVTVLVGQNESGKTGFLHALDACRSARPNRKFDYELDYPRRTVNDYRRRHPASPATVATLQFQLTGPEIAQINAALGMEYVTEFRFTVRYDYKNEMDIEFDLDEAPYVKHLVEHSALPAEVKAECAAIRNIRKLIEALGTQDLNAEGKVFVAQLGARFAPTVNWGSLLEYELWHTHIEPRLPKFFYFDDYNLLPGKVNLADLAQRMGNTSQQSEEDQTVLSLLRLADVNLMDLTTTQGYEQIKTRLEGLSNTITDTIFEYWTQNRELDVEFDIRPDPTDRPPFNAGMNLYIRIKNRRHRASVPFSQRSKGFIWFFSFIVWFDTIKQQLGKSEDLILLLDEPGLSLHALAQADFLRYIDDLSEKHQILYTTHSPFMLHNDRLHQVRLVEDRRETGTVVTSNLNGSDPKTVFPLQAALGYTIAQNLFISQRNLLVEGPADLVYLKYFSAALEGAGRTGLRPDVTVVPTGGLDKLATFIALLGANQLELVVLHDWASKPDPRLDGLVRERIIKDKLVLHYGLFRSVGKAKAGAAAPATDVEDLFSPASYLKLFNATFAKGLGGREVKEVDLADGERILERLNRYLADAAISLRPSGGFNHYAPATHLASNPPKSNDKDTLARFEELFKKVNSLFSPVTT